MNSLELFAGGGGLAVGIKNSGFSHTLLVERDADSCNTLRWNFKDWNVVQKDIQLVDFGHLQGSIDLVTGGPPCQPFSIGGKHKAFNDHRDMFPQAARVVAQTAPKAFIFENVRGLTRESFRNYFQYVILRLTFPFEEIGQNETWFEHLARLERLETRGNYCGLKYKVLSQVLNAADYGVPQKRYRVFFVGFRDDIQQDWNFPLPTHSENALIVSKWIDGSYWDEHLIRIKDRPKRTASETNKANYLPPVIEKRWRTVRDAIFDLPHPSEKSSFRFQGHRYQPGAKPYPGHTGSVLDLPAKTLKAGDHGVPGGENMLALPDGTYRYFTVRESARLQTFPDSFEFPGSWTESMRQIGNAVPVSLAEIVAKSVHTTLEAFNKAVKSKNVGR